MSPATNSEPAIPATQTVQPKLPNHGRGIPQPIFKRGERPLHGIDVCPCMGCTRRTENIQHRAGFIERHEEMEAEAISDGYLAVQNLAGFSAQDWTTHRHWACKTCLNFIGFL